MQYNIHSCFPPKIKRLLINVGIIASKNAFKSLLKRPKPYPIAEVFAKINDKFFLNSDHIFTNLLILNINQNT